MQQGRDLLSHALDLADSLLEEVELSSTPVSHQARKAFRLARILNDEPTLEWLKFELRGIPNTDDGRRHMGTTQRWINREEGQGYWGPVADAEETIETLRQQLDASQVESFSGDFIAVTAREHRKSQQQIAALISSQSRIVNRVQTLIHEFVTRTYYELAFSQEQQALFESARAEIDGLLAPVSGDSLEKVESIYRRLSEGDREAISQAMNTCRRLIESFADAVYPPTDSTVERGGTTIDLGADKSKNRINEYVNERTDSSSRRKRIRRSLAGIYDRVATGIHNDVTPAEARYLFLSTYTLLGEILSLKEDEKGPGA